MLVTIFSQSKSLKHANTANIRIKNHNNGDVVFRNSSTSTHLRPSLKNFREKISTMPKSLSFIKERMSTKKGPPMEMIL